MYGSSECGHRRTKRATRAVTRDAPSVQRHRAFMLKERDGGEDGVGGGRVEEADERIGLFVGD